MTTDRVMLLIDADNVSVDVMEQAVYLLHKQHGGVHVRRAYCTAESALKHQNAFKRLGIKPMVNLAAGKNSTDIAMAARRDDLVCQRPSRRPGRGLDFAAGQLLREKGCVVRASPQARPRQTQDVYDDYTVLAHRKPRGGRRVDAGAAQDGPRESNGAQGRAAPQDRHRHARWAASGSPSFPGPRSDTPRR